MSDACGLRYARYGPGEWLTIVEPQTTAGPPPILLSPPLFEEMNRLRAFMLAIMRSLARAGHRCALPDLPGTNESERRLDEIKWLDWRAAVAAAAAELGGAALVVSFRGGCLIDDAAVGVGHWRLTPIAGAMLIRDMERARRAGGAPMAGYPVSPDMRASLTEGEPATVARLRTVRLASDPADADIKLDGPPLWRRSEPSNDPKLASALARDISEFAVRCANF